MTIFFRIAIFIAFVYECISLRTLFRKGSLRIQDALFWFVFNILCLGLVCFSILPEHLIKLVGSCDTVCGFLLIVVMLIVVHMKKQTEKIAKLEQKVEQLAQEIALQQKNGI